MEGGLITLKEAADYTGLSQGMIEYFRQVGDLPYHADPKGGVWFTKAELRRWFSNSEAGSADGTNKEKS